MPDLPPDAIAFLKKHEKYLNDSDSPDTLDISDPTIQGLLRNATLLENFTEKQRALDAKARQVHLKETFLRARERCVPTILGVSGLDPRSGIDCRYDPTHRLLWVPISVWPMALPPKDPNKRINPYTQQPVLIVGETQVRESTAIIPILTRSGEQIDFSITGFARIELSSLTPAETISRLETRLGSVTPLDHDDDAKTPAFIPSLQPPTSTPNPSNSPFDTLGNSLRPTTPKRSSPPQLTPYNL